MKSPVGVIVFVLIVVIAAAYLLLGGGGEEDSITRPKRVSKRVKIDVPPPVVDIPGTREPQPLMGEEGGVMGEEGSDVVLERPTGEAEEIAAIPEKKDMSPESEEIPASEPVEREEEQATPQKQVVASKTPQRLVTSEPASKETKAEDLWVVNVVSLRSMDDASKFMDKLKNDAYNAYLTEFEKDNTHWYRVRVGFFSQKQEAEKAGQSIAKKYLLSSYWVVKPSKKEITAHR